jgi:hypothetical protein
MSPRNSGTCKVRTKTDMRVLFDVLLRTMLKLLDGKYFMIPIFSSAYVPSIDHTTPSIRKSWH